MSEYRFLDAPDDEKVVLTARELRGLFYRTVHAVEGGVEKSCESMWYVGQAYVNANVVDLGNEADS